MKVHTNDSVHAFNGNVCTIIGSSPFVIQFNW